MIFYRLLSDGNVGLHVNVGELNMQNKFEVDPFLQGLGRLKGRVGMEMFVDRNSRLFIMRVHRT